MEDVICAADELYCIKQRWGGNGDGSGNRNSCPCDKIQHSITIMKIIAGAYPAGTYTIYIYFLFHCRAVCSRKAGFGMNPVDTAFSVNGRATSVQILSRPHLNTGPALYKRKVCTSPPTPNPDR